MRKIILIIVMFLTGFLNGEMLTLERAQKLAEERNPDLQAAENEMLSGQKQMQGSFLSYIPSSSLSYSKAFHNPGNSALNGTIDETSSIGISASQPLFNGGKIYFAAEMAKNSYKMKEASYRAKQLEIKAETESKYYAVQSNEAMVKALEKSLQQSRINLDTAKAKMSAGLISKAEYLQMESETLSTELDLLNMRNALELSKLSLSDYIGYKHELEVTEFSLNDYEEILLILLDMQRNKQKHLTTQLEIYGSKHNPDLQISALVVDTAEKSKLMAAGNFLPSLNLSYSYNWQNSNIENDYDGSSSVILSASLPIFPLADNVLDYQSAQYELKGVEKNYQSAENSISLAIRSSCLNLYTAARSVEAARISKEAAWESWLQMRENFEQGMISASDLLSVEVMVLSADTNYIKARQDFLMTISGLVQLTGMDDKNVLLKMIEEAEDL